MGMIFKNDIPYAGGVENNIRYNEESDSIQVYSSSLSKWVDVISGCVYYLALIPTLSSYSASNGNCIYSSELNDTYKAWYAFDGDENTIGATVIETNNFIGYQWNNNVKIKGVEARYKFLHGEQKTITFKLQYLNGSEWVDIEGDKSYTFNTQNMSVELIWSLPDYIETNGIRIYSTASTGTHAPGYSSIQVYGMNN